MKKNLIVLVCMAMFLMNCSYGITRTGYVKSNVYRSDCNVVIKKSWNPVPKARKIGTIQLYDSGFSSGCSKEKGLAIIRQEACAIKASVVVIRHELEPDLLSTCYRATADFYAIPDSNLASVTPDVTFVGKTVVDARPQESLPMFLQVLLWVVGYSAGYALAQAIL